jgi:hypothetical protein
MDFKEVRKMKLIGRLSILSLVLFLSLGTAVAGEKGTTANPLTLTELAAGIGDYEKKEIVITGTIIGACKSGCKMWISDGEWKEGDLHALVRAKDDAYKFATDAAGKTVTLTGIAVAKKMDYCAEKGELKEGESDECDTPVDKKKEAKACADTAAKKEAKLEITFFATSVDYGE